MDALVNKRIKQVLKGDQNAYADIVNLYQRQAVSSVLSNAWQ